MGKTGKVSVAIFVALTAAAAVIAVLFLFRRTASKDEENPVRPGSTASSPCCPAACCPRSPPAETARPEGGPLKSHRVVAYYFHNEYPCGCSGTIEDLAARALAENFPEQMEAGALEWRSVNIDAGENAHFAEEYALSPVEHLHAGLVLVEVRNEKRGRHAKLERVDEFKGDEEQFKAYVQEEIRAFLKPAMASGAAPDPSAKTPATSP